MNATAIAEFDPRTAFLEARRLHLGGSDSASLFDEIDKETGKPISRYGCATRLYFDKKNIPPDYSRPEREEAILKRGNVWESIVANMFVEETGWLVRRWPMKVSKEHPHMAVNMDRQICAVTTEQLKAMWPNSAEIQAMEGECGPGYLECKTTNEWMFKGMMKDGITVDYIFQVNHGLVVTGYKWGVFAVLEPTWGQFATFPVVFMPSLAEEQIKRSEAFWQALEANQMPEPKVNDSRCKSCLWRRSCPRSKELLAQADKEWLAEGYEVVDSPELVELVSDYRDAMAIADEKAETADAIKRQIKLALGATVTGEGDKEKWSGGKQKVEVPSCGVRISWTTGKAPMRWDSKALDGTVNDLGRFDIPEGFPCSDCEDPAPEATVIVATGFPTDSHDLWAMCEACGFKAVKAGAQLVARKGVSNLVASCKRPGEPSRSFRFIEV